MRNVVVVPIITAIVLFVLYRRRRRVDARERDWPQPHTAQVIDARGLATIITGLGAGDSELHLNVLADCPELSPLQKDIEWSTMAHRGGDVPRLMAIQGDGVYRHPADAQPAAAPFHPLVARAAKAARAVTGHTFNHCLLQWYRGGRDYISEHADKTLDASRGSPVANLSLGATRVMTLRDKRKLRTPQKIVLPHNSLFVLGWRTNREFTHAVARDGRRACEKRGDEVRDDGHRISFTLRSVATFERGGILEGQGAPDVPRRPPAFDTPEYAAEHAAMIAAFSAENRNADFDWDAHYGCGFSIKGFRVHDTSVVSTRREHS